VPKAIGKEPQQPRNKQILFDGVRGKTSKRLQGIAKNQLQKRVIEREMNLAIIQQG
jgi:hypothetical protein